MSTRNRIVHVTNTFADDGTGITNMLVDLAHAQLGLGWRVEILASTEASSAIDRLIDAGGSYTLIPRPAGPATLRRAAKIVRNRTRGAIVHAHTVRAVGAVVAARPFRWRRGSAATVHNKFQRSSLAMAIVGATVCVSRANCDEFRGMPVASLSNLHVVPNGVVGSPRLAREAPELGIDWNRPTILYAGGMSHRKGVDLLIRRFNAVKPMVPGARLIMAGNPEPEILYLIDELGLADDIDVIGLHPNPSRLMAVATVVAVPSRSEPFGLVALEARSAGAAIVASDVGGLAEVLGGGAGVLIAADDDAKWVATLTRLLTDRDARLCLQTRAKRNLDAFTTERMALNYEEVYRELRAYN